ncbi:hypothetical protein [Adhaeribacter soli]|uniref:Uncharacterized protein n=1 Tax=Adhaeribacter soli TaxID=2607655 RepID=A0A5N1IHU5_9BACT|nr:hypothetical protein [Adhaeribacter soli]KAA9324958.1 hypothetical protein F0P94_18770 [Adhaeribacter soli]
MENKTSATQHLGHSNVMGPELRKLVETQLLAELPHYKMDKPNLKIDWSNSQVEGHSTAYLDGTVENYSGILVLDENNQIVADGWMEFILEPDFFLAYWDHITTREGKKKLSEKQMPGIPKHVWKQIPEALKEKYSRKRLK